MVKLTVLYGLPEDAEAFEDYYADTHAPLAERIPNLRRFESGRIAAPDGGSPPYHRIAELWFESASVMQQSLASPEGKAATDDIPNFATGGATVFVSEVES